MLECQITSYDDSIALRMRIEQNRAIRMGLPLPCRCGAKFVLPSGFIKVYKCFYCSEIFCGSCAATHFGKTSEIVNNGEGI